MLIYADNDIKGVIFDLDGTLIDSLSCYYLYFNNGLEGIGLQPISKRRLFKFLGDGISLRGILRILIPDDREESVVETVADEILRRFMRIDMELPLLPGVRDVFAFLKASSTAVGVATARPSGADYEWERFRKAKIADFIDVVVTASEVKKRKPAPDSIIECARKMNTPAHNCLVVGDSVADILAAKDAGSIPVAVSTGIDGSDKLKDGNPAAILDELDDLIALFQSG